MFFCTNFVISPIPDLIITVTVANFLDLSTATTNVVSLALFENFSLDGSV